MVTPSFQIRHMLLRLFLFLALLSFILPGASAGHPAAALAAGGPTTYYHSGAQEGSTAIALDNSYMLVGDDNDNILRLYDRRLSTTAPGASPVQETDLTSDLGVNAKVDIEASTTVGSRVYWIGSHSNGGNSFQARPDRQRLFATDLVGSGASTTLNFVGHYDSLRTDTGGDLVAWGDAQGYDFTSKIQPGVDPETTNGFNIEGLTMAPDGTTAYIGFRAPLVGLNGDKALIAPVANVDDLVTGNSASASIGNPIELDLGGRGIRSVESYYAITHPSFPNYLALTAGSTFGVTNDCTVLGSEACNNADLASSDNLAYQFESAGISWKAYMESMPAPCFNDAFYPSITEPLYAQKHNPFIYYDNIRTDAARCNKIVPFEQLAQDIQNNALPQFVWITPNQVSDMHGISTETFPQLINNGDNWLKTWVPQILASQAWQDDGLLVITFDEGIAKTGCCGFDPGGGRIVTLLISPLSKPCYRSTTPYNHYSLLRTIEENWSLPLLNHANDAGIQPMTEFFTTSPIPCSKAYLPYVVSQK